MMAIWERGNMKGREVRLHEVNVASRSLGASSREKLEEPKPNIRLTDTFSRKGRDEGRNEKNPPGIPTMSSSRSRGR